MAKEALAQDLADFLVTKNFDPEYFDEQGQPAEAGDARTIKFDYQSQSGKNYGTAVLVLADDELSFFFGDNLGRGMEPDDKPEWYEFLEQLSDQAASHSVTWTPSDINRLKHTLSGIAAIKEGLFEGYYGTRRVSYMGEATDARLVIRHNRTLGETDKRYRYVESLFIETADQERFRLPFRSLSGGRAMLEHVRSGGRPYDVRGCHIAEIVSEMAVLGRFHRAQQHRIYEGVTQELVESAVTYYRGLQETLRHLGTGRGYKAYFESWTPDTVGEAESLVEDLRTLFVEQSVDARIEAALPTLAKIQQQGNKMKEAQIFEAWANRLAEGTWALPDTPEAQEKLNKLMSRELIVGPDATNATEQLYDVIGDDELFDILHDLADRDPRANCWADSDVQARLAELGIQTPESTESEPADVDQDEAPAVKESTGQSLSVQELATISDEALDKAYGYGRSSPGNTFGWQANMKSAAYAKQMIDRGVTDIEAISDAIHKGWNTTAQAFVQNPDQFDDTAKLAAAGKLEAKLQQRAQLMKQNYAQLPEEEKEKDRVVARALLQAIRGPQQQGVAEGLGYSTDPEQAKWYHRGRKAAERGDVGVVGDDIRDIARRFGCPPEWLGAFRAGYRDQEGYNQQKGVFVESDLARMLRHAGVPVSEGSCNMTMEGEYCPEHGLMECGSMEEDGGAVGMPYSMGEAQAPHPKELEMDALVRSMQIKQRADDAEKRLAQRAAEPHTLGQKIKKDIGNPLSKLFKGDVKGALSEIDDPINYNAAMTGSYYEGKETDIQEGDALLARIKSLALLR